MLLDRYIATHRSASILSFFFHFWHPTAPPPTPPPPTPTPHLTPISSLPCILQSKIARPGKDQPLSALMRAHWDELTEQRAAWLHVKPVFVKRSWTLFVAKAVVEVVASYRSGQAGRDPNDPTEGDDPASGDVAGEGGS